MPWCEGRFVKSRISLLNGMLTSGDHLQVGGRIGVCRFRHKLRVRPRHNGVANICTLSGWAIWGRLLFRRYHNRAMFVMSWRKVC